MTKERKTMSRETLSVSEASRRLGVGLNQGYEAVRRGEIPSIRIGKRILVPRAAFERLLSGEAETGGRSQAA